MHVAQCHPIFRLFFTCAFAIALAMNVGCGCTSGMQAFNIDTNVSQSVDRSFDMMLVGLRPQDADMVARSVDDFFYDGDFRSDLFDGPTPPVTYGFDADESGSVRVIDANDETWSKWRDAGVMELMVLVSRLSASPGGDGPDDPRRRVFSIDRCHWQKQGNLITIDVQLTRMSYSPQPDLSD